MMLSTKNNLFCQVKGHDLVLTRPLPAAFLSLLGVEEGDAGSYSCRSTFYKSFILYVGIEPGAYLIIPSLQIYMTLCRRFS